MHTLFAKFAFFCALWLKQRWHVLLVVTNYALKIARMSLFIFATKDARLILLPCFGFKFYWNSMLRQLCSYKIGHWMQVTNGAIVLLFIFILLSLPFRFDLLEEQTFGLCVVFFVRNNRVFKKELPHRISIDYKLVWETFGTWKIAAFSKLLKTTMKVHILSIFWFFFNKIWHESMCCLELAPCIEILLDLI